MIDFLFLQISSHDHEDSPISPRASHDEQPIPSSPPPSFRSRASSPTSRHLLSEDPISSDADRTLADTFDDGSDNDSSDGRDDRQRLMHGTTPLPAEAQTAVSDGSKPVPIQRTVTEFPGISPSFSTRSRATPYSAFTSSNDGVFANLSAKPERGEKNEEEKPPVSPLSSLLTSHITDIFPHPVLRSCRCRRHSTILGNHHPRPRPLFTRRSLR